MNWNEYIKMPDSIKQQAQTRKQTNKPAKIQNQTNKKHLNPKPQLLSRNIYLQPSRNAL